MSYNLLSFQDALEDSKRYNKKHLLTGNGFSIACRSDIFRYDTLYEQADFSKLSLNVKNVFEVLNTKDFEIVMKNLMGAAKILTVYAPTEKTLISSLEKDAEDLKNVLVEAIASSHPEHPSTITEEEYACCKEFLSHFDNKYTLNYDLLLYWTTMHYVETGEIKADDGFSVYSGKSSHVVSFQTVQNSSIVCSRAILPFS